MGAIEDYSRNLRTLVPANASWVDDRIGPDADAPYLFGTTADPFREAVALWQLEFWNRSIAGVYGLGVPPQAGIPELQATFDRATGEIVSSSPGLEGASYVLTQEALDLAERRLEASGEAVLYAVDDPLLVESTVGGVFADGWMGSDATYDRYSGGPGTLTVSLSREAWARSGQARPRRDRGRAARRRHRRPSGDRRSDRPTDLDDPLALAEDVPAADSRSRRSGRTSTSSRRSRRRTTARRDARQLGAQVAFGFAPTRSARRR